MSDIFTDRYRGRDDRYSDYDNNDYASKPRRERRKDRSGNVSERGDNYSSGYFQQPNQQFGYDPYSSYYQHQQYYENLRQSNPVAYAEWYNRYFANQLSAAASAVAKVADVRARESGRESVHSGRSSSKDNDRYILFFRFSELLPLIHSNSNCDCFCVLVKFIKCVRLVFIHIHVCRLIFHLILVLCCCSVRTFSF